MRADGSAGSPRAARAGHGYAPDPLPLRQDRAAGSRTETTPRVGRQRAGRPPGSLPERDDEVFGFEQTSETILNGCKEGLSADALLNKLLRATRDFSGEREQEDDQTIVVVAVED